MSCSCLFKGICYVFRSFEYVSKFKLCWDSGQEACNAYRDEKLTSGQKATRVAANSLFCLAQGAEIVTAAKGYPTGVQMTTKSAAGVLDLTRHAVQGAPCNEMLLVAGYRAADVVGCAYPGGLQQMVETGCHGYKHYLCFKNGQFWFRSENTHSEQGSLIPMKSLPPRKDPRVQQILEIQSIDELDRIPELFQENEGLRLWICPISGLPIRYAVVISSTMQTGSPVYYEKSEINRWFEEHRGEFPPQWPLDLPLQREQLTVCHVSQCHINKRLTELVLDLRAKYSEKNE